ncbi:MAG: glycogen synthase GlgA [Methylococcaceae bacterium]|nr:glycogen synthase GlgA [Methylococcaceae bacterium]
MKKILFATSEAYPFIKTGGLADVSNSLPKALAELGQDVRLILPNYGALKHNNEVNFRSEFRVGIHTVRLLETKLPDSEVIVWLVDCPEYFGMNGNPYVDEAGDSYPNNAERFALFCRAVIAVAMNRIQSDWKADIVHCNDWQTGLIPALLSLEYQCPQTVFTIHNIAYQGLFSGLMASVLRLPTSLLSQNGLEFHGMISFIKGGLVYADKITTVSPTYVQEIQTPELGYGLEGLLIYRNDDLKGIINGIDADWNPENDSFIPQKYSVNSLQNKVINKTALQTQLNLPLDENVFVIGLISRLVEQKGIDLILDCFPKLLNLPIQIVILGSGDKYFEKQLSQFSVIYPHKMALSLGYDESLAHLIEAGSDVFLMPSRFEPCGLNQMYSQRYGTLPIVRSTGGLADTVVDTLPNTIKDKTATGFVFNEESPGALLETVKRAVLLHSFPDVWIQLQTNAMTCDFSWENSAKQYLELYEGIE